MVTNKSWERASALVESLERPHFTSNRALAGMASTGGVITVEGGFWNLVSPAPIATITPIWPRVLRP